MQTCTHACMHRHIYNQSSHRHNYNRLERTFSIFNNLNSNLTTAFPMHLPFYYNQVFIALNIKATSILTINNSFTVISITSIFVFQLKNNLIIPRNILRKKSMQLLLFRVYLLLIRKRVSNTVFDIRIFCVCGVVMPWNHNISL